MKKIIFSIFIFSLVVAIQSCSTVKVLDSWKSDNLSSLKDKNILVVARTDNNKARMAFEESIANELRSKGVKATESFKKFPKLNPDKKPTEERQQMIKTILESEGYNGVVLSVVKDYKESIHTSRDGGYYAGGGLYPRGYPSYYFGFYNYYNYPMSYSTFGNYVPESTTTDVSRSFVLETVAYNMDAPEGEQLVAVVTSSVSDPRTLTSSANEYAKEVGKSLETKK